MVAGSVGKIGKTYTLDLRMFSVESGAIINTAKQTYKGDVEGLLKVIELAAKELIIGKEEKKSHWVRNVSITLITIAASSAYFMMNQPEAGPDPIPNPPGFPNMK